MKGQQKTQGQLLMEAIERAEAREMAWLDRRKEERQKRKQASQGGTDTATMSHTEETVVQEAGSLS